MALTTLDLGHNSPAALTTRRLCPRTATQGEQQSGRSRHDDDSSIAQSQGFVGVPQPPQLFIQKLCQSDWTLSGLAFRCLACLSSNASLLILDVTKTFDIALCLLSVAHWKLIFVGRLIISTEAQFAGSVPYSVMSHFNGAWSHS